jgi:hypothetical protein
MPPQAEDIDALSASINVLKHRLDTLEEKSKQTEKKLNTLLADFRTTQCNRAKIIASQALLQFLGEQPRLVPSTKLFSSLKHSPLMKDMLKEVFLVEEIDADELLDDFDYLLNGRHAVAHLVIDNALLQEVKDLCKFLKRADNKRRLTVGVATALKVLKNMEELVGFEGYPKGIKHKDRISSKKKKKLLKYVDGK